ncbi:MAG: SpoIIE family protein phosphatase, partial [Candidatus Latescibacteria bacterium]|nr:SpoIIE family protein phosphatase [bacterium]MBD3424842.1 SpoIIE family protein phosphatase [Candidatus Latescibacterota bacterium]
PRERLKKLGNRLLSTLTIKDMKEAIADVLSELFEAANPEILLKDEIRSFVEEEYMERMEKVFSARGEPVRKLDFIEAMGFERPRGWTLLGPSESEIEKAVISLPAGLRRIASFELIVPVVRDDSCSALLLLGVHEERGKYTAEEITLLSMLSNQIASALSRIELLDEVVEKRVMEEELNIAREIQQNLLPSAPPQLDRYEVSSVSVPSKQVGGDYFDYLVDEEVFAFVVADVAGKGVPASLLMASLQASIRSMKEKKNKPVAILEGLNDVMCDVMAIDKFATMFYGCIQLGRNRLVYSNAGHFFPVIVSAEGDIKQLDYSGLVLGVQREFSYRTLKQKMNPGDMLVITTDGVIEAEDDRGDLYGEERLHSFLSGMAGRSAREVRDAIAREVARFSAPGSARDDMTIMVIRRNE